MLLGAKQTIQKYKSLLAVSIYHNAMDMFQVPLLVLDIVPEYRLSLRHNTVTCDDTILYAYLPDAEEWVQ